MEKESSSYVYGGADEDEMSKREGEESAPASPSSSTDDSSAPQLILEDENAKYTMEIQAGCKGAWFYFCLASWWCAYSISTAALVSVVWPAQISAVVDDPKKEDIYNGFVPSLGAMVSLIVTPIAGSLSDHSTSSVGRRKIYIIIGSIIGIAFMIVMGEFSSKSSFNSVYALMILIMGFQFGMQWAGGPYAGLMPDLVPRTKYGIASGWLGLAVAVGDLIGALGAGFLIRHDNFWYVYAFLTALFIVFSLPTIFGITEIPRPPPVEKFSLKKMIKEFKLDPKKYYDFYWVIITRFLEDMAIYSILPFFEYYYKDVVKVASPTLYSSLTVAAIVVASIPSTIVSGWLSDKFGCKLMVYVSTLIMGSGAGMFCIVVYRPSAVISLVLAAYIGIGYGAYQAVDWALALSVLPPDANVAKDMGIWHLAFVLPQVISPIISGAVLQGVKERSVTDAYAVIFALTSFWFILSMVFVYPVGRRNKKGGSYTKASKNDVEN